MTNNQTGMEKRLLFLTAIVLLFLAVGSLRFADWRITLGVLLGGALSFLNIYWLKTSVRSLFGANGNEPTARFSTSLFLLRYFIIASVVAAAAMFGLVSVAASIVGLLSFAFAILLEAFIQIYFVIVNREED